MFRKLTLNSILWMLMGLGCLIAAGFYGWEARKYISRGFPLPGGLLLTGLAMSLCGLTNGFTDQSPWGRKFKKLGILCFIAGLPLFAYALLTAL
jgi:hypothetical protein